MAVITYKCKNCGGELVWSPEQGKYACPYCDSVFTEAELEESGEKTKAEEQKIEGDAMIYNCPNCGAEIVTDATTAATFCFYCHNPVILTGRLDGAYMPQHIIPFEVGKEEAVKKFLSWTAGKRFVPKDFFSQKSIEKMTGVYFPFWVTDADVEVDALAEAKKIDVSRIGDRETTRTSVFNVTRQGTIHLEDLSKNALKKADRDLVEAVLPFQTKDMKPFKVPYLSSFQAEKRDLEQQDLQGEMDEEIRSYTKDIVTDSINSDYADISYRRLDITPVKTVWEYALFPVWVLTYHRKGDEKLYYYALNGQTGKIAGELPVDTGKLLRLSLFVGAVVFALALLLGYLL